MCIFFINWEKMIFLIRRNKTNGGNQIEGPSHFREGRETPSTHRLGHLHFALGVLLFIPDLDPQRPSYLTSYLQPHHSC